MSGSDLHFIECRAMWLL